MNTATLKRRIGRLIEKIDATLPAYQDQALDIDYTLFTDQERQRLHALLERIKLQYGSPVDLRQLTDNELHQLSWWIHLYIALQDGDQDGARLYRSRLAVTYEEVKAWFLALDINRYPKHKLTGYPFSVIGYRHIRNSIERGRDELENLLQWYEHEEGA